MHKNECAKSSKKEMMEWIQHFTQWPHRKTGTPEGYASAEFVREFFQNAGLENVKTEEVPSICHSIERQTLKVGGDSIDCLLANGTNRKEETGNFHSLIENAFIELVQGVWMLLRYR